MYKNGIKPLKSNECFNIFIRNRKKTNNFSQFLEIKMSCSIELRYYFNFLSPRSPKQSFDSSHRYIYDDCYYIKIMAQDISETALRKAVDTVFKKYDINEDSRLENFQIINLFKDTLLFLGKQRMAYQAQAREFMQYADLNHDNKIDKEEMLIVFKKAISNYSVKK